MRTEGRTDIRTNMIKLILLFSILRKRLKIPFDWWVWYWQKLSRDTTIKFSSFVILFEFTAHALSCLLPVVDWLLSRVFEYANQWRALLSIIALRVWMKWMWMIWAGADVVHFLAVLRILIKGNHEAPQYKWSPTGVRTVISRIQVTGLIYLLSLSMGYFLCCVN